MNIMLVLDAAREAVDAEMRRDAVKWLRKVGLKTVVAFYVKVARQPVDPLLSSMEKTWLNQRVMLIEQSQPKELCWLVDYFILVPGGEMK